MSTKSILNVPESNMECIESNKNPGFSSERQHKSPARKNYVAQKSKTGL